MTSGQDFEVSYIYTDIFSEIKSVSGLSFQSLQKKGRSGETKQHPYHILIMSLKLAMASTLPKSCCKVRSESFQAPKKEPINPPT